MQFMLGRERNEWKAQMEIMEDAHNQFDVLVGSLADESDYNEENLFHDAEFANRAVQGGLEKWLVHAFELNGDGVGIEVADFYGKMHAEDSLSREVSLEN